MRIIFKKMRVYVASMSRLGLRGGGSESYPERPDEPDCVYYLRTGVCGYGSRCQFNHPPNRPPVNKFSVCLFWYPFVCLIDVFRFWCRTLFFFFSIGVDVSWSDALLNLWFNFSWKLLTECLSFKILGLGRSQSRSWRVPRENGTTRVSGIFSIYHFILLRLCRD